MNIPAFVPVDGGRVAIAIDGHSIEPKLVTVDVSASALARRFGLAWPEGALIFLLIATNTGAPFSMQLLPAMPMLI